MAPLGLSEHVAREAEQVPADQRGPEAAREPTAEQEHRPGRERRQGHGEDVVGGDRVEEQRQRRQDEGEAWHGGDPRQVGRAGRPDEMGDERVLAERQGVWPPGERPDEDHRVVGEADVLVLAPDDDAEAEVEERDPHERGQGQSRRRARRQRSCGDALRHDRRDRESNLAHAPLRLTVGAGWVSRERRRARHERAPASSAPS